MSSLLISGGEIVRDSGSVRADILVEDGVITKIGSGLTGGGDVINATNLLILPGLIDCHVHFREPGLEQKETLETGSAAALAGGVTTVCEMPNTIPPTVTVAALADKVRRSSATTSTSSLGCDIRFFFGATEEIHLQTLRDLWTSSSEELQRLKKRCSGLKLYLDHSTGNQKAPGSVIDEAFRMCGELGIVAVCHCEDADMNKAESEKWKAESDISFHSKMRPAESEAKAIDYALGLAKKYGTHLHVAHLSTSFGIDLVRKAKKSGITVTCEVAPHHLFLTVDDYKALGTLAKMNPPLRTADHQAALWQGIADGTVDCISTDHAPHMLKEKQSGDPLKAPSGVPGVETMAPLLLSVAGGHWPHPAETHNLPAGQAGSQLTTHKTVGRNLGTVSYSDIVRLCFTNPNRIFNLGKKGITEGVSADLIIVDPAKKWRISAKELHSKCGWTPYQDWLAEGRVVKRVI